MRSRRHRDRALWWLKNRNRAAALGENVVLLINLAWSAWLVLAFIRRLMPFAALERWQTGYLPVYAVWAWIVVLVFLPLFSYAWPKRLRPPSAPASRSRSTATSEGLIWQQRIGPLADQAGDTECVVDWSGIVSKANGFDDVDAAPPGRHETTSVLVASTAGAPGPRTSVALPVLIEGNSGLARDKLNQRCSRACSQIGHRAASVYPSRESSNICRH